MLTANLQPESANSRKDEIVWRHVTEPQSLLVNHLLYRSPSLATDKLREQIVLPVHEIASEPGSGACCFFLFFFLINLTCITMQSVSTHTVAFVCADRYKGMSCMSSAHV